MKEKKERCIRCEVLGKKNPNKGIHMYIGPNGLVGLVCDICHEELQGEDIIYEIKENEGPS